MKSQLQIKLATPETETTIIPKIIDEPRKAECLDGLETIGYFAAEISRLRGKLNETERERDMYEEQVTGLLERLGETQMRMIDAERICNKIYIARNISLSEESMLSALVEIDKRYRTKHDGN